MSDHAPLPQDAFRTKPISGEDKYFAQREAEILEDLKDARKARSADERRCPCAPCEGAVLERVMHSNIEIDRCPKCNGVWLDSGELELLTTHGKQDSNAFTRFFRNLAGDYSA